MYYLSIALIILFLFIILKNYLSSSSIQEGLVNKASDGEINNLKKSMNEVENNLKEIKQKNDNYNSELAELEKKADCKNKKNANHSSATKAKQQQIKDKQKKSQKFNLGGF